LAASPAEAFDEWKIAHLYTTSAAERDDAIDHKGFQDEGVCCGVPLPPPASAPVPLFRLLGSAHGDHLLTASLAEADSAIVQYGYSQEGNCCFVYSAQVSGSFPLFRLRGKASGDRFYTTSAAERDSAVARGDYVDEGPCCYVPAAAGSDTIPLYRLLNRQKGLHFYTTSAAERDQAIAQYGYQSEGICCQVAASGPNVVPIYRLFQPGADEHFYTISETERGRLLKQDYRSEGICCYAYSSASDGVPLFRLYSAASNLHFYTTDPAERDKAYKVQFANEGTCCTVAPTGAQSSQPLYRLVMLHCRAEGESTWQTVENIPGTQCPAPPRAELKASPNNGYEKVDVVKTLNWTVDRCGNDCTIRLDGKGKGYAMGFEVHLPNLPKTGYYSATPADEVDFTLTASSPYGSDKATAEFTIDPNRPTPAGSGVMPFYFAVKASNPYVPQCSWLMLSADTEEHAKAAVTAAYGSTYTVTAITADQFNQQKGCP
jgi:hypothetical protein